MGTICSHAAQSRCTIHKPITVSMNLGGKNLTAQCECKLCIFLMILCHPMYLLQQKLRIVTIVILPVHLKQPSPLKQETPPKHQFLRNDCCEFFFWNGTGHHTWYQVLRKVIFRPGWETKTGAGSRTESHWSSGWREVTGILELVVWTWLIFWELGDVWKHEKMKCPFIFQRCVRFFQQ